MNKTPISIIIDDFAPIVHMSYEERESHTTSDGRPLLPEVPFDFLLEFCDVVERHGLKGKLSVVPLPGTHDVYSTKEGEKWCKVVHDRLEKYFSFCPEMITHTKTLDLKTGKFIDIFENEWSFDKDEDTLCDYISYALELSKKNGFDVSGVTSPRNFGTKNLTAYENAISRAFDRALGKKDAWYFLKIERESRPYKVLDTDGRRLCAISATTHDFFWESLDSGKDGEEYARKMASGFLSEDGEQGQIRHTLDAGGHPVFITHWQALFSNGARVGLRALDILLDRIEKNLPECEFKTFDEKMKMLFDAE